MALLDIGAVTPSDTKDSTTELNCNYIMMFIAAVRTKDVKVVLRNDPTETPVTFSLRNDPASNNGFLVADVKYVLDTGTTVASGGLFYGYDSSQPPVEGTGVHAATHPTRPGQKKEFGYINVND